MTTKEFDTAGLDLNQPMTPAARQALLELVEAINAEIRGLRQRLAHLPWSKVELFTAEGSPVAALPDARKDEDEAQVKEAKKHWSAARKELKGVLEHQKDRLYEALCTARTWAFEDWQLYLNQHPIVRYYTQRLVWLAERAGAAPRSFRPLDDGSLTDLADETVVLEPGTVVRLAHDSNVTREQSARWLEHCNDYEVSPLFQQFGKGVYTLPEGKGDLTGIEDFRGHVLEAFALRGRATRLGYRRGSPQDGAWFVCYEKRFPTLGIEARLEFTGNLLPEEKPESGAAVPVVRAQVARGAGGLGTVPGGGANHSDRGMLE